MTSEPWVWERPDEPGECPACHAEWNDGDSCPACNLSIEQVAEAIAAETKYDAAYARWRAIRDERVPR